MIEMSDKRQGSSRPGDRQIGSFVEIREDVCDRDEVVKESEIPVWKIVRLHKKGFSIAEILEKFTELTRENVKGAISYYYCHRRRIERQLSDQEQDGVGSS